MNQTPAGNFSQAAPKPESETSDVTGGSPELRASLAKEYKEAQDALRYMALDFDEFEDMLFFQSGIHDDPEQAVEEGSVPTIVLERAGRVLGQLPSGVVNALSLKDEGKSLLMNLVLKKYVYPKAKTQYSFKTKLFLWNLLANTYGSMAMVYDWVVKKNYTGPDCWLVPIRNFFPQQGRFSIADCDWVDISAFVSVQTLREIVDDKVDDWDLGAINQILDKIDRSGKNAATLPAARNDYLRVNPMWRFRRRASWSNTGDIELVTKYERGDDGRWITFAPDYGNIVVRNIPNPHESGEIPVVVKYALPTLDSIIGLGDMERGRHIQRGIDSSLNLDLDFKRLRVFPPVHVTNSGVTMPSLQMRPFAKWLMQNVNNVQTHQFPNNDSSNNLLFQMLKGAATNVSGSTQTAVSQQSSNDPSQGKTPAAIEDGQQSQSTRDAIDRGFQDEAMEELINGFCCLINSQQKDPIDFYLFKDEIKQIAEDYPDVEDVINYPGKKAKSKDDPATDITEAKRAYVKIPATRMHNEKGYLYEIDPDSTPAQNQEKQHEQLNEVLESYMENPQMMDQLLAMAGMKFEFGEAFKRWLISGGVRDAGDLLKQIPKQDLQQQAQAQAAAAGQPGAPAAAPGAPAAPMAPAAPVQAAGPDPDVAAAMQVVKQHAANLQGQ